MQSLSRAEEAVGRVSLWRGKDVQISSLSGGLTNENYLVEAGGERYVMRLPGTSTELLSIDRESKITGSYRSFAQPNHHLLGNRPPLFRHSSRVLYGVKVLVRL